MESHLQASNLRSNFVVEAIESSTGTWRVSGKHGGEKQPFEESFDAVIVATPAATAARLLRPVDHRIPELLPQHSSSAIVVALGFDVDRARSMEIPAGFGFLVPQREPIPGHGREPDTDPTGEVGENTAQRALLACTFLNQKFPHTDARRGNLAARFLWGPCAPKLLAHDDATLIRLARAQLERFLESYRRPLSDLFDGGRIHSRCMK